MAMRPIWEGHLRLSLVACPVSLFTATSTAHDVHFHLINPKTGHRIRTQTVDPDGGEVARRDLVRGFEVEPDRYVLLTDEEIKSVRLESTRTLDIERFVEASGIDRIWWDAPYYMVPDGKAGVDAFNVIRDAMEAAGRVALGRLVIGTRERVVAIEPRGRGMLMTTLRSFDEVRAEAELFDAIPKGRTDAKMVDIAARIIAQQEGPFDPTAFDDRYEDALRALIESKQAGAVTAAPPKSDNVIDLMEALRRSLEGKVAPETPPPRAMAKRRAAK
jgi:DNA end-binding protein Ku